MKATIQLLRPGVVRLRWQGIVGIRSYHGTDCYADFDACPARGLSPEASAMEWALRVLGTTATMNGDVSP